MLNNKYIYQHIWQGYKTISQASCVLRSGFPLVGLVDGAEDSGSVASTFRRRNESILEHSAKVAYLASAFVSHFPNFFGADYLLCEDYPSEIWAAITTALLHDIGEVATGDIPDDGNPLHDAKDIIEKEFFDSQMAPAFSLDDFLTVKQTYASFQDRDTTMGQALYCLDKIEAILTLLWLEQYEEYGIITAKPLPTEQDRGFMFLTGTPCATDCWAAHTKVLFRKMSPQVVHHVYALLRIAVEDVRGEWFEWWDKV